MLLPLPREDAVPRWRRWQGGAAEVERQIRGLPA